MKVGLVGYLGFGNYGDELYRDIYRASMTEAEFSVLRGCDGVREHSADEVEEHDAVIIGGGDLVISARPSPRYWHESLLRRPVFISSVGVDDAGGWSPDVLRLMREFFQHPNVRFVSARDHRSRDLIERHLQPTIPVRVHPDLVGSRAVGRRAGGRQTLGLVLRAQHEVDPDNTQRFIDSARRHGYHVRSILLGIGCTADEDLPVLTEVDTDEMVVCGDLAEVTRTIASCDRVVSQRLHGCVTSMMMGIPTIGLRTAGKFRGWFQWFGASEHLVDIWDPRLAEVSLAAVDPPTSEQIEQIRSDAKLGLDELVTGLRNLSPLGGRRRRRHYLWSEHHDGGTHRAQRSPRLVAAASASLDLRAELEWYRDEIARWKGISYLEEIDEIVDRTPRLRGLSPGLESVVAIPVAATAEAEGIYRTLALYALQDRDAVAASTLLLYLNHSDAALERPKAAAAIERCHAEVDRARADFPDLPIAMVRETFDSELPGRHGGIIGYLCRRMYDVALMAVLHNVRSRAVASDVDVLLIRNDADTDRLSPHYLAQLHRAASQHRDTDVFMGGIRWGTGYHTDYPGFAVATLVKEVVRALTMRHLGGYHRTPATNGSNVAIRMSTLAAVGGVGSSRYYGAGGDDVEIGARVNAARRNGGSEWGGRRPFRYVPGAQVDASGERILAVYRTGQSLIHSWDTFNRGPDGYTPRRLAGIGKPWPPDHESPDVTVARIEQAITDLASAWYVDPLLVSSAMALIFGTIDPAGNPLYLSNWNGSQFQIRFTEAGRDQLLCRLARKHHKLASHQRE